MSVNPAPVRPLHRFARRVGGVASLALAPLLVVQAAALWLIRDGAEVEVPAFVAERLRPHLEQAGLRCTWSSARVSLSGRIALTDASIGPAGVRDAVFEAGRLVVVLDPFDLLFSQRVSPKRLWLDRGRLLCPASLSPSGRREVAMQKIRAALRREGDRLVVDTLQAECGGIPLVVHGRVLPQGELPARPAASAAPAPAEHPLRAPGLIAARLVSLRPWLATLERASLELRGEDAGRALRLRLTGLADALNLPDQGVRAERLHLALNLIWDDAGPRPVGDAVFGFGRLEVARPAAGALPEVNARCGAAELRTAFGPNWELPTRATLTAHRPEFAAIPLDRIVLTGERLPAGRVGLDLAANWQRENVSVRVILDPAAGSAEADFDARVCPDRALTHPAAPKPADLPAELAGLSVPGTVSARGHVSLAPGWKFASVDVSAETGSLRLGATELLSAAVSARATPDLLLLPRIELQSQTQRAVASVRTGYTATSPYRILVRANAYPEQVRPYVGKWWDRIWADLALSPGHPASIDLDVSGQWDGLPYEHIYAAFSAEKLSYRKQVFDHVCVRLLEEPAPVHRISIFDMRMRNGDGTHARGRLEWRYAGPEHKRERCQFAFAGRLQKDVGVQIAGDDLVAALAEVTLEQPLEGEVFGLYHGVMSPTPNRDQLQVRVRSQGPFSAWKIPGEDFCGTVLLDDRRVEVKDATLRYAGGDVAGSLWLNLLPEAYRMTFRSSFKGCDREAFLAGIAAAKGTDASPTPAPKPAPVVPGSPPVPRPILSGDFRGRVILPDMSTLEGKGYAVLKDPSIPAVPLLGAFSRGLTSMGVESSTYRFDTIDGDFFIRNEAIWCPALKVRGPDSVVDVRGKYQLGSGDIRFRATLVPKKSETLPVLAQAIDLLSSSTKIFPVDLTGTLEAPEWSIDPTPSALITRQRNDSLGLPPPPRPDDGKW